MEDKPKALVFGIVAPPKENYGANASVYSDESESLATALPHLPRYKEETSIWKIFQAGIKPPIPGKLR